MENEVWLPVIEAPFYEVSNLGRVRNSEGLMRKLTPNKQGYITLTIRVNNVVKTRRVHRLVCLAFLDNPENLPDVNHIDGCKTNNCLWNLEWTNDDMNMDHAKKNGLVRRGEQANKAKLKMEDISIIRAMKARGHSYGAISNEFKVTKRAIEKIVKGLSWKHI